MSNDALEVVQKFWQIQDDRDYEKLVDIFSDDAVLEDPVYGTFKGKQEIAGFMAKMNEVMAKIETHFNAIEISGGGDTAWCQWEAVSPQGKRQGCGLYKVRDGKMTYYRDYMNAEDEQPV